MAGSMRASELIWHCLLGQPVTPPADDEARHAASEFAARLARRLSPSLMQYLLEPLRPELPGSANALLLSRLSYAAQKSAWMRLEAAGLEPVALKGFANAHRLYDDPVPRIVGDLDVLLERRHLATAIGLLAREGFRFAPITDKRWGLIGDASFAPFHSVDGVCNIDFHIQPDSWPLPLGLTADDVRSRARHVAGVRMPSDESALLIAVANAAKDKFGWRTLGKALDLSRLLHITSGSLDWDEVRHRARAARLEPAMGTFFSLLRELGGEAPDMASPNGVVFRGLVEEWQSGFVDDPGDFTTLAREALLAHTAKTALALNVRRLSGLLTPYDGVPPEGRAFAYGDARSRQT